MSMFFIIEAPLSGAASSLVVFVVAVCCAIAGEDSVAVEVARRASAPTEKATNLSADRRSDIFISC